MRSCLAMAVPIITSYIDLIIPFITGAKMATAILHDITIRYKSRQPCGFPTPYAA
jgi:hypothetical protein